MGARARRRERDRYPTAMTRRAKAMAAALLSVLAVFAAALLIEALR